ncbi:MAG: AbrB family transcriptional regulator [Rhodospirillaceae bacterium]|jgi:membrane AbrB-like protein
MMSFSALRERFPLMCRALMVGVPAGAVLDWLDTPIPWMIGPMVAVAILNLFGIRALSIPYGRQTGQIILGSAVSIYFTPPVVAALVSNTGLILGATLSAFLIGGLGALIMSKVSGVNAKSAFFASIPGGSMAMANLADKYNAQIPPVAVAHSLRVSILVIVVPYFMTYGGVSIEILPYKPDLVVNYGLIAIWLLVGGLLGELSERLNFHNGCFMVPIFLGALLTMSGFELSLIPGWMADFAQLMFGLILGERYERAFFVRHKLFIPFAIVNAFFIISASVGVAFFIAWISEIPLSTLIIATAPGGLAEMTIVAQALQIGVPLVIAFHMARIIVVNIGTQYIYLGGVKVWEKLRLKE